MKYVKRSRNIRRRGPGGRRRLYRIKKSKMYRRRFAPMSRSAYPLGTSTVKRFKYTEFFTINPSIGSAGSYVFKANDLYDPNFTGTGHQPYGFDQIIQFYNHFQVLGAKVTFKVYPGTNAPPFVMGVRLDDTNSLTTTNVDYLMEQPRNKRKLIGTGNNTTDKNTQITHTFSGSKFFRVAPTAFKGNRAYMGTSGSSPSEEAYFICWIGPTNGSTDLTTYDCSVEIEYIARFTEPREVSPS